MQIMLWSSKVQICTSDDLAGWRMNRAHVYPRILMRHLNQPSINSEVNLPINKAIRLANTYSSEWEAIPSAVLSP
jgi:hypothetical protein